MARRRRPKGSISVKHVRLHTWLIHSQAARSLPAGALWLLVLLYDLYNGHNNGELFMSVRTAADLLSVDKNTASKWFRLLEDRGFIRARVRGSFNMKVRHATTWELTEFECGDRLPTKDFMSWKPAEIQKAV